MKNKNVLIFYYVKKIIILISMRKIKPTGAARSPRRTSHIAKSLPSSPSYVELTE